MVKINLTSLKSVFVTIIQSFQTNWKTLVWKIDLKTVKIDLRGLKNVFVGKIDL